MDMRPLDKDDGWRISHAGRQSGFKVVELQD
jgi:hypothetical protein